MTETALYMTETVKLTEAEHAQFNYRIEKLRQDPISLSGFLQQNIMEDLRLPTWVMSQRTRRCNATGDVIPKNTHCILIYREHFDFEVLVFKDKDALRLFIKDGLRMGN